MTFSTFLIIVIVAYALYYSYQIINDLFLKKDVADTEKIENEQEVDVSGMTGDFRPKLVSKPGAPKPSYDAAPIVFKPVNTGAIKVEDFFAIVEDFANEGEFSDLGKVITAWGGHVA